MSYTYLFKIILLGDSKVGKSCFCSIACNDKLPPKNYCETIALDFYTKIIPIKGKFIKTHLWDTTGNNDYSSLISSYFSKMTALILMYDISNQKSFDNIKNYLSSFKNKVNNNKFKIFLIANKKDMYNSVITTKQGQEYAKKINAIFYESSCLCLENFENNPGFIITDIINKINDTSSTLTNIFSRTNSITINVEDQYLLPRVSNNRDSNFWCSKCSII
jgi:Ras-related protein Rab-8A